MAGQGRSPDVVGAVDRDVRRVETALGGMCQPTLDDVGDPLGVCVGQRNRIESDSVAPRRGDQRGDWLVVVVEPEELGDLVGRTRGAPPPLQIGCLEQPDRRVGVAHSLQERRRRRERVESDAERLVRRWCRRAHRPKVVTASSTTAWSPSQAAVRLPASGRRWANASLTRGSRSAGAFGSLAVAAIAPFSLISHRRALPWSAWVITPAARNRQPATKTRSHRSTALRELAIENDDSQIAAPRAAASASGYCEVASRELEQLRRPRADRMAEGEFAGVGVAPESERVSGLDRSDVASITAVGPHLRHAVDVAVDHIDVGVADHQPSTSVHPWPPAARLGDLDGHRAELVCHRLESVDVQTPSVVDPEVVVGCRLVRAVASGSRPRRRPRLPGRARDRSNSPGAIERSSSTGPLMMRFFGRCCVGESARSGAGRRVDSRVRDRSRTAC